MEHEIKIHHLQDSKTKEILGEEAKCTNYRTIATNTCATLLKVVAAKLRSKSM